MYITDLFLRKSHGQIDSEGVELGTGKKNLGTVVFRCRIKVQTLIHSYSDNPFSNDTNRPLHYNFQGAPCWPAQLVKRSLFESSSCLSKQLL